MTVECRYSLDLKMRLGLAGGDGRWGEGRKKNSSLMGGFGDVMREKVK